MMIPAGGETSASRDRRFMNDAMSAAGRSLVISSILMARRRKTRNITYGDARKVSRSRKNRALYLTCMTSRSRRLYSLW
jgi:hypothetical protein